MVNKITSLKRKGKQGQGSPASPGPISKKEWKEIGPPLLQHRKLILHTDGARAYRFLKISGVQTTQVKHKRPNPIYVARRLLHLPDDAAKLHVPRERRGPLRPLWVKAGTQIIDGVWKVLRQHIPNNTKAEDSHLDCAVREFQWVYWNSGRDRWAALGDVFASLR